MKYINALQYVVIFLIRYKLFSRQKDNLDPFGFIYHSAVMGKNWKNRFITLIKNTFPSVMPSSKQHLQSENKYVQLRLLELFVSCAIYKNPVTYLSLTVYESIMMIELKTTVRRKQRKATKEQGNFDFTKANNYWWHRSMELQSLLFIGITNCRQQTGQCKCIFPYFKFLKNRKDDWRGLNSRSESLEY